MANNKNNTEIHREKTPMFDSASVVSGSLFQPLHNLENKLEEALYSGEGYKTVAQNLTYLENYTKLHFSVSGTLSHHYQLLVNQVNEWVSEYNDGLNVLTGEILHFLRHWLNSHSHLRATESISLS
ncbi:MAG: hypothetical protein V7739_18415 [Motiliproteus sp.]